jgi:photosystem II stability/assembly factor-like uncharacterized protein
MKKNALLFILVVISILTKAQWVQVNGPKDPFMVTDMITKDSLLLISTSCGAFYSSDTGLNWEPVIPESFYTSVLFHDTIYTGGESYHLYGPTTIRKMTFVNGLWESVNLFENSGPVNDMFANQDTIFVAFANDGYNSEIAGFTYSVDGLHWHRNNTGLPKDSVLVQFNFYYVYNLFAVSANQQYAFVGTNKGIYRSPKSVFNWSAKNLGLPEEKVSAIFSNDTVLFIAINNKLYKSSDQGESWAEIYSFSASNSVNRIRLFNDTLFVVTENQGLYLSGDWGAAWFPANNGLTSLQTKCIGKLGSFYFLGGNSGIVKGLNHWETTNNKIICSDVRDLEQTDSCIAAIEFNNVFISKDTGISWTLRTPFQTDGTMWSIINVNDCLFLSFNPGDPVDCMNYLSCDNGDTWSLKAPLVNNGDPFTLRSNGSMMVATEGDVIYISADNGNNWTNISPPPGLIINDFSDVLFTGNDLYISAVYNKAEIIHSSDFGITWNHCDSALGENNFYKLGYASGAVFAFSPSALFKSVDHGQTWLECGSLGDGVLDLVSDGDLIFACKNTRVFYSRDNGIHWIDISAGLPPLPNLWGGTLMVRNHFLYYGTNNFGIWEINTENLPSSVNELSDSREFELYPNPADGELNIFSLGNKQIKGIEIIDLNGRVIHTGQVKGNKIEIDFLKPNFYLLRIETTENNCYYEKFVKL